MSVPAPRFLPGQNEICSYVSIGDEAFALKPYLMRPFPYKQTLTDVRKEKYNPYKLSMDSNPGPLKETTLLKWAEEVDSGGSDIESEGDYILSDHDTESEVKFDEEDNENLGDDCDIEDVTSYLTIFINFGARKPFSNS
ncbi:unnamed protein product [Acanthoscelides obtectus]|uniref:DDE Tnp4 domain-containing protein n=1 Tax=Acanthoscelides obtectus TaxID=200917 RepID=A0A9P0P6J7_ACAOB|nr:unnamed protein product [Acanthoscelides obtectus]CAK1628456.1 hypothetical protein AOBTE_LOCUS5226 [Acanthoscelides obtectus]